jgi:hypothetical protein
MDTAVSGIALAHALPQDTLLQLQTMFRDPRLLSAEERTDLIQTLHAGITIAPEITELRVLLGMAECVDYRVQSGMETLREAVRREPDNFLAQLKLGELLMRLRVCDQAVKHTDQAARLAANPIQSELARRQAATLRTMLREGVERGGVTHPLRMIKEWFGQFGGRKNADIALVGPS